MKTKSGTAIPILLSFGLLATAHSALGQGTAFTYQGRLNDGANPANGNYDFRFKLYVDPLGNNQAGSAVLTNGVAVSNGLFMVALDFGPGIFTGSNYWLEVDVMTNGGAAYTDLAPLQGVTPAPYAIFAQNATGLAAGSYTNAVTLNNAANSFAGTFTGNGAGLTNVNAASVGGFTAANLWKTTGNTGTSPTNNNFLGTLDVQPLELHVGGLRALRLEPDPRVVPEAANLIGGFTNNLIQQPGSGGDVIVGGGYDAGTNIIFSNSAGVFIGAGSANQVGPNVNNAVIVGGYGNTIGQDGAQSVIGGGYYNTNGEYDSVIGGGQNNFIQIYADHAFIGGGQGNMIVGSYSLPVYNVIVGGYYNTIPTNTSYGFIGGGFENSIGSPYDTIGSGGYNTIGTNSNSGTISGGFANHIGNNTFDSTIGGGSYHTIGTNSHYSTIAGGRYNSVGNNATASALGGGYQNAIQANAFYATIPGGANNTAGGPYATVGGGTDNTADSAAATVAGGEENTAGAFWATVAGGQFNTASGAYATVAGGWTNTASGNGAVVGGGGYDGTTNSGNTASGNASVVGGGLNNEASGAYAAVTGGSNNLASGNCSFAAGADAQALYNGCFVWADDSGGYFTSTTSNQFAVRATGGVQLITGSGTGLTMNGPGVTFSNNTTAFVTGAGSLAIVDDNGYTPGITISGGSYPGHMRFRNAMEIWPNGTGTSGGYLDVRNVIGTQTIWMSGTNGNITCINLIQTSDRNAKQDFAPISPEQILDKVLELPVSEWSYKQDAGPRHIGPMAQDFYSIFNIGTDDKHIAPIDEGGVAFAAIQGLNRKLEAQANEKDAEILKLKEKAGKVDALEKRLTELEQVVQSLTEKN